MLVWNWTWASEGMEMGVHSAEAKSEECEFAWRRTCVDLRVKRQGATTVCQVAACRGRGVCSVFPAHDKQSVPVVGQSLPCAAGWNQRS